ncbi:flavodoxin [Paenibacillus rigui]|uniref:Flavodoxin n=1 Tax=Paenibacillus rigui TaxID=554312 RepID=A0A229UTE4_9BACL|nr:flavodoxin [Paenibacillus rigui]OXM86630.1 flavodoxin [Paenibacillus rigui]
MAKVIIVYASMTGNTEEIAEAIRDGVRKAGIEPEFKSAMDAKGAELLDYDVIIVGAYTWGDGDLPDEFLDFYEELDGLDLSGKKAAAFGSCDSSYSAYGAAVDTITAKFQELGADVVNEGLKIELNPSQDEKQLCSDLGEKLVAAVTS